MSKLTKKELKEMLGKIETELNFREFYEEEFWTYKVELKKDSILIKVYDDEECREDYLEYTFKIDIDEDIATIIKNTITYIYENELNYKNKFVKGYSSFTKRKIKSLELWDSRNDADKCKKIQNELIVRYRATKEVEYEIECLKDIVKDMYNCLTVLVPVWRLEDIKNRVYERCNELKIENVNVDYENDTLYIIKKNEDKFDIKINGYCNIGQIVEQIIQRVGKVA